MKNNNKKVLLHACCAICAGHPLELLREDGYEPVVYFCNPNIYPSEEYAKRLDAMNTLCDAFKCELICDAYERDLYNEAMKGYEDYPEGSERCIHCFEFRMRQTALKARELNIKNISTSLTSSPHKKYEIIQHIGMSLQDSYNINYLDYNFKKKDGFLKTLKIAKSLNLYRQNYCGCENSMRELSPV